MYHYQHVARYIGCGICSQCFSLLRLKQQSSRLRQAVALSMAVIVFLMMLTTPKAWAEWVKVGNNDSGVFYLDPSTLTKSEGLRRISMLIDWKARDRNGALSTLSVHIYDCEGRKFKQASVTSYREAMAKGAIVVSGSVPGEWQSVPSKGMIDIVCTL
jgi:hypothetical protein